VGLFAEDKITGVATGNGLFFCGGFKLLSTQVIESVSVIVFSPFSHLLDAIKATMGLRVSRDEEIVGLYSGEHGMEAYAGFQLTTTDYVSMKRRQVSQNQLELSRKHHSALNHQNRGRTVARFGLCFWETSMYRYEDNN